MNEFENTKVGDLMVVRGRYAHHNCLQEVERVTKSQIVVNKRHYWKKDGRLVGTGDWYYGYIRPATENEIERIIKEKQKDELIALIRKVAWRNLSLETIQTIYDFVKKDMDKCR